MNVMVNGERRPVAQARNVAELVRELQLVPETLLVEHNGIALHRAEWSSRCIAEGDKMEFVRVVAGG